MINATQTLEKHLGHKMPALLLPKPILAAIGVTLSPEKPIGYIARLRRKGEWSPQNILGVFAYGLLPGGGGPQVVSATAARFTPSPLPFPSLEPLLPEPFHGFVFALLDPSGAPTSITTSPPGGALLGLLEGVRGPLSPWLENPTSPLFESWTSSLVISRHPWPEEGASRNVLPPLPPHLLRHFWTSSLSPSSSLLGWATGWDVGLGRAVSRATRTAKALHKVIPDLQWRIGAHKDLLSAYGELLDSGIMREG